MAGPRKTRTEQDVQKLTGRRGPTEQRAVRWDELDNLATKIGAKLAGTQFARAFKPFLPPVDSIDEDALDTYLQNANTIAQIEQTIDANTTYIDNVLGNTNTDLATVEASVSSLTTRMDTAEADISNEQIARADADTALASDISSVSADLSAAEANVTANANAIATIEGYQAATYTLRVGAGGASAGLELVAADDPINGAASAIRMSADNILLDGTVSTPHLKAGAVTANEIDAGAVTADKVAAYAITSDKVAAGAIVADSVATGTLTVDKFAPGAIKAPLGYIDVEVITSSQASFQFKHPGMVIVFVIGGGGSGGAAKSWNSRIAASGGGAGGFSSLFIREADQVASYDVTIGAGAPGSPNVSSYRSHSDGNDGGASSFIGPGVDIASNGGKRGLGLEGSSSTILGGLGGTASGGDYNYTGGKGGDVSGYAPYSVAKAHGLQGALDFGLYSGSPDANGSVSAGKVVESNLQSLEQGLPPFFSYSSWGLGALGTGTPGQINTEDNSSGAGSFDGGDGIVFVFYLGERSLI